MVFGANALIAKSAISLSPIFVVAILNRYGFDRSHQTVENYTSSSELKTAMFMLTCLYPICLGLIQVISWSRYSIRAKTGLRIVEV